MKIYQGIRTPQGCEVTVRDDDGPPRPLPLRLDIRNHNLCRAPRRSGMPRASSHRLHAIFLLENGPPFPLIDQYCFVISGVDVMMLPLLPNTRK